ncbi:hypothetical protein [Syntrophomonas erecta]
MKQLQIKLPIIAIVALILMLGLVIFSLYYPFPSRKPEDTKPVKEPQWYIVFSVQNQKATAYTAPAYGPVSSSGQHYSIGSVAVHPRVPVKYGGDPLQPIIPFGTVIHLKKPLVIQGNQYYAFKVTDTGDINYRLWPDYPYWIDVFHGTTSNYTVEESSNFGTDMVDYFWIEEWR